MEELMPPMERDDIEYLSSILGNMDGDEEIRIGITVWSANDLSEVVRYALFGHAQLTEL